MSDQGLVNSLNALLNPRQRKALKTVEPRGPLNGRRATATFTPKVKGGGGLVSPIVEESRTLHPPRLIRTTDGLLAFSLRRTDELRSVDAEGTVEIRRFPDAP
ncbi:MAG: hypothetical protein Q7J46_14220 [Pseudomonas sp.]|nr:hypothetical protein [Pseudomonas sp.]